ncbi:hypothetical protein CVT25_012698 [Psilocybe cyanescens]|uniref:Rad1-domain-containing protein n=1 Tax=Psilocybe cyanescens TaxID=93625 RepID=A0A409VN35_PSICY|nr:hypothetical protein CVT25_012698 [Psilocybe cyanescens]
MAQDDVLPPVLTASVHDVRYFVALLRGVQFSNRATVTVTETGLTITVEEARTLLGTAFIFADVFDEYTFHAEPPPRPRLHEKPSSRPKRQAKQKLESATGKGQGALSFSETESESEEESNKPQDQREYQQEEEEEDEYPENAAFEIPLNTLIECLNIFGTAGPATGNINSSSGAAVDGDRGEGAGRRGRGRGGNRAGQGRGWPNRNEGNSDGENGEDRDGEGANPGQRGLDAYFGTGGSEKRTSMRLSYPGGGYPLTLIIAEDASGPTTTCEITTFDPEPHLELDFDNSKTVLKIILKSSWLRDALSELDPSCEKLTFVGNPPTSATQQNMPTGNDMNARQRQKQPQRATAAKPMLRIQATGSFGSTEMDYPNDRDVLETFECTRSVTFSYRFGHIARTIKALSSSTKTSLRIDDDGLLSLQFLMPSPKPRTAAGRSDAFIEFRCLALDDGI